jgi:hypothetical protein
MNLLLSADIYDWARPVKAITSILYGCPLGYKFTRETSINKFEIHNFQVVLWN